MNVVICAIAKRVLDLEYYVLCLLFQQKLLEESLKEAFKLATNSLISIAPLCYSRCSIQAYKLAAEVGTRIHTAAWIPGSANIKHIAFNLLSLSCAIISFTYQHSYATCEMLAILDLHLLFGDITSKLTSCDIT